MSAGHLVVGGPEDGTWVVLPPGRRERVVELVDRRFLRDRRPTDIPITVPVVKFRYVLFPFAANGTILNVLAPENWTGDAVLVQLIDGYRRPAANGAER